MTIWGRKLLGGLSALLLASCVGATPVVPASSRAALGGDLNNDGVTNALDLQAEVNVLLGRASNAGADVNGDGAIDARDLQALVNDILGVSTPCTYSLAPAAASHDAPLSWGNASLQTGPNCPWTMTVVPAVGGYNSWIWPSLADSGVGPADFTYMLWENAGASRTGTISIGGQTLTITQRGAFCGDGTCNGGEDHASCAADCPIGMTVPNFVFPGAYLSTATSGNSPTAGSWRQTLSFDDLRRTGAKALFVLGISCTCSGTVAAAQTLGTSENLQRIYAAGGAVLGATLAVSQPELAVFTNIVAGTAQIPYSVATLGSATVDGVSKYIMAISDPSPPYFAWPGWFFDNDGYAVIDLRTMTLVASGGAGDSSAAWRIQSAVDEMIAYMNSH